MIKKALILAAAAEALTGLALVLVPSVVGKLLFGQGVVGVGGVLARVAGLALIGLGVACWPGPPRVGMLTYSSFVTLYLAYLGITGVSGVLLWPAAALHLILAILLTRAWMNRRAAG